MTPQEKAELKRGLHHSVRMLGWSMLTLPIMVILLAMAQATEDECQIVAIVVTATIFILTMPPKIDPPDDGRPNVRDLKP
jgi:bacteriorhodopsin